jgi:hypothetical protein
VKVNCLYADDFYRPDSVTCAKGLYGGRPSAGICTTVCPHRRPDPNIDNRGLKPFKPVLSRMAPELARRSTRNMAVCDGCNHKIAFNQRHVRCNKASRCKAIATWQDGDCPLGLWERAPHQEPVKLKYQMGGKWLSEKVSGLLGHSTRTAFLLAGGPSTEDLALDLLDGQHVMAMNNSHLLHKPTMWTCMDNWHDPFRGLDGSVLAQDDVMKFVPHYRKTKARNVWRVGVTERFDWWRFFSTETVMWDRSTFVVALRILYDLGFRRVFLLGVDFNMQKGKEYAMPQGTYKGHLEGNNRYYVRLQQEFELLQPVFQSLGFHVYNCNPKSLLTAFPFWGYHKALKLASAGADTCLHGTTSPD